ncbi:MAG TPA: Lar family restriction alleviation protein [Polyangiaceae bacterium]|nr:Lar family restriction alleviation protein [Polyangiaceae bacterium]
MTTDNPVAQPAGVEGVVELLPCPFCGGEPVTVIKRENAGRIGVFCGVGACAAFYARFATVEQWNTRATPADIAERARRIAEQWFANANRPTISTRTDEDVALQVAKHRLADIIAAEFTGGERGESQMNKWYVATMNDCIFIVDQQPRPAPVDHVNPNAPAPSVVISMRSGSREAQEIAEEIVKAHNGDTNAT